jgi:hypothetical protein
LNEHHATLNTIKAQGLEVKAGVQSKLIMPVDAMYGHLIALSQYRTSNILKANEQRLEAEKQSKLMAPTKYGETSYMVGNDGRVRPTVPAPTPEAINKMTEDVRKVEESVDIVRRTKELFDNVQKFYYSGGVWANGGAELQRDINIIGPAVMEYMRKAPPGAFGNDVFAYIESIMSVNLSDRVDMLPNTLKQLDGVSSAIQRHNLNIFFSAMNSVGKDDLTEDGYNLVSALGGNPEAYRKAINDRYAGMGIRR